MSNVIGSQRGEKRIVTVPSVEIPQLGCNLWLHTVSPDRLVIGDDSIERKLCVPGLALPKLSLYFGTRQLS